MGLGVTKEVLLQCCGSRAWVEGMWKEQPFAHREDLIAAARKVWWKLGERDWLEAFAHHPRIGGVAKGQAQKEQSGVAGADDKTLAALAEGNRRYEEKFGFVFLICATGKNAEEMLAMLNVRLTNDRETEFNIAADEQEKIMQLRLEKLIR